MKHYFAGLTSEWEMIYYRVDEYIAQGDRVVALGQVSFRHKKTGKILVTPKADFHKFRDGKICEFFEFYRYRAGASAATTVIFRRTSGVTSADTHYSSSIVDF